jgi:hypothetical protein
MTQLSSHAKQALLRFGGKIPKDFVRPLVSAVKHLELGAWMESHDLRPGKFVATREELFALVAQEVGNLPALYLEFGVASGQATRAWSRLLLHPDTVLHGFDSFEGLPERWGDKSIGTFSTGGTPPEVGDPRVTFFKGWFQQTLPAYSPPKRDVVIINMDADLYSSTILVLRSLKQLFRPGTYLYFDEFGTFGHEEKAFREFVEETGTTFRLRAGTRGLNQLVFQCIT